MLKKRDRQREREKRVIIAAKPESNNTVTEMITCAAHTPHTHTHTFPRCWWSRFLPFNAHTDTHTRRVYYYTFTPLWPFRLVCPDDIGLFNEYRLLTHWSNTKRKRAPAYVGDAINYWNVDKSECLCRVASFCIWLTKEMVSCARTQFNICIYRIRMLLLWSFLNDRSAISNWWIFDMKTYPTHRLHGMDVANHLITLGLFT